MTEPRPTYTALPDPLTPEQLEALFDAIRRCGTFGRVTLVIERGRPLRMEVVRSINLERLENWDKLEDLPK